MKKYFVCYCWGCHKETKHKFIEHDTGVAERIFLGICSVGISEILVRKKGECCDCSKINET